MSGARNWLALSIGVRPEDRVELVRGMLRRHARDRVGYWFQVALSTGIATLGLALGSSGIVIGAMLISPLMAPLVELGMGLAIGSPILVVRSFVRTVGSVAAVIGSSAAIAAALPYESVTQEIASRTAPTLLDLFVAALCALAAVFTTVRTSSDTITTAAGTAIGISLVPPLCVGGYGLGTGLWQVSAGALLLFTANFSAIVLFAVLSFLLLRFDEIDVHTAEHAVLEGNAPAPRAARWLHVVLGSRHGRWLRVVMPLAMASTIFFPLRRALIEVSWKTRVRKDVQLVLASLPAANRALRSTVTVEYQSVVLRLVILGSAEAGRKLRTELEARVAQVVGVRPVIEVVAVPDVEAVRELALPVRSSPVPARAIAPILHLSDIRDDVATVLQEVWPVGAAGPILSWSLDLVAADAPTLEVSHLGEPLGSAGEQLLATALTTKLGGTVRVVEQWFPAAPVVADAEDIDRWLPALASALEATRREKRLHACVTAPAPSEVEASDAKRPSTKATAAQVSLDTEALADRAARHLLEAQHERVQVDPGPWSVRLSTQPCPKSPAPVESPAADGAAAR